MSHARPLALVRGALLPSPGDASDSVLVENGRIALVGRAEEVLAATPPEAEIVELGGRTLSPAFHDAHFHFLQTGIKAARPTLRDCRSRQDVYDAVRDAARGQPGPALLVLEEWDETCWTDPAIPTRDGLDAAAPGRPVLVRRIDDHTAVANGPGLELLTAARGGGGIDRASGLCREGPVLLLEELFPPDPQQIPAAFREAARLCLSVGVTTACDFLRPGACRIYAERLASADLGIRVNAYVLADCLGHPELLAPLSPTERFRLRGVKIFADGSIGARAAALFEDYADRPGERGTLCHSDDDLLRAIRAGHEAGLSVAVHAIGDRAIAQVVDAFAKLPRGEVRERHHRIEHLELPRPLEIDRIAALGLRPCVQPNFVGRWAGPGGLYETALGRERARAMNPFRTLLRRGTGVFFGSDGMPASPLYGIRSALRHPVEAERLTLEEAHRLYTSEPAAAVGEDRGPAGLAVGAGADLVVLPTDPGGIPGDDRDEVDLTVMEGRVVHRCVPLERDPASC